MLILLQKKILLVTHYIYTSIPFTSNIQTSRSCRISFESNSFIRLVPMCKPYEWSSLKALDSVSAWWNLTGVLPYCFRCTQWYCILRWRQGNSRKLACTNMSHRLFPSWRKHGRNPRWQFLPDLNSPIFMLSFIRRSLSLGLVLNLNTLPDEDLYSMSSWESSFMARPIVWLVFL